MELIDKAAVIAEIESKFQKYWKRGEESDVLQDGNAKYWGGVLSCLNEIKTFINTLEAKEVDLEKEIDNYFNTSVRKNLLANDNVTLFMQCYKVAKHFFELGIAVSKTQKGVENEM